MIQPKADFVFPIQGKTLPVDHGFVLYSAICKEIPHFHQSSNVGLGLIRGRYIGNGILDISPFSRLKFRFPPTECGKFLGLADKSLSISGHMIQVGNPHILGLKPSVALHSHIVTTKNGNDEIRFREEIRKQLTALQIDGQAFVGERRTMNVHGKQIVGFSLTVTALNAEESICLQEVGLGGRRKMGCGFFESLEE